MGKQMQKRLNNTQITLIQQGVEPWFDQGMKLLSPWILVCEIQELTFIKQ